MILLLINIWIVEDRPKYKEVGEGWFHHQEANQDPLSFSSTPHEGGQEKGPPLWIWYSPPPPPKVLIYKYRCCFGESLILYNFISLIFALVVTLSLLNEAWFLLLC